MNDNDLRRMLKDVIEEIDSGRITLKRPGSSLLRRLLRPGILAASLSLGMGAAGCDTRSVGSPYDGTVQQDVYNSPDAAYMAPFDAAYMAPFDAGPQPDAGLSDAAVEDAEIDGGMVVLYMGPPPIEPDEPQP